MSKYAKKVTAQQAVQQIQNGDRVVIGHACGEPVALTRALGAYLDQVSDVETVHMIGMGQSPHCSPQAEGHVRHNSLFLGASEREAVFDGRADFVPCHFSKIPALFRGGLLPVDVALVQVSAPDRHGYVSFGVSVDYTFTAAKHAKTVIAQINRFMPRCHGDCFMHVSEFDLIVEEDIPLLELQPPKLGETEQVIARHCAELVSDGATLQLGIGALPDAVLLNLKDKKDLGIHTEMFSDGVIELVEAGVITNRKKTLNPGKMVATFLMGSQRLYHFVDDNPSVMMAGADYTNDPFVIAQNDKLVSINSCVQVDLMGQICSESVGMRQISGTGGQVDFVRGAARSRDGISIIAIPSTAMNGAVSKIVPFLDQGTAITTSRSDVMYVVTEYGAANLQGKNLRQRARALIEIAHPRFQAGLSEEWERRFHKSWL